MQIFYNKKDQAIQNAILKIDDPKSSSTDKESELLNEYFSILSYVNEDISLDAKITKISILLASISENYCKETERLPSIQIAQKYLDKLTLHQLAQLFVSARIKEMHYPVVKPGVSKFIFWIALLDVYNPQNAKNTFIQSARMFFNQAKNDYSNPYKNMTIMFCYAEKETIKHRIHEEIKKIAA